MTDLYKHFHTCPKSPYRGGSPTPPAPAPWPRSSDGQPSPASSTTTPHLHYPSSSSNQPIFMASSSTSSGAFPLDIGAELNFVEDHDELHYSTRTHMDLDEVSHPFGLRPPEDDLTPRAGDHVPFFEDTCPQQPGTVLEESAHVSERSLVHPSSLHTLNSGEASASSNSFQAHSTSPVAMRYRAPTEYVQADSLEFPGLPGSTSREHAMREFLESERLDRIQRLQSLSTPEPIRVDGGGR